MSRRELIFGEGTSAAALVGFNAGEYPCPICSEIFTKSDLISNRLTEEHVPPKFKGGKVLLLTCAKCNNSAGSKLEAHLKRQQEQHNQANAILSGSDTEGGHVVLSVGGFRVNASLSYPNGKRHFSIQNNFNDPTEILNFKEAMRQFQAGSKLNVTSKFRYNMHMAKLADLKSCFLILVAKLGYTFAFSPTGDVLRRLILEASATDIPLHYFYPKSSSFFNGILADRENRCFVVSLSDRYAVINWQTDFLAATPERVDAGKNVKYSGVVLDAPKSFEAICDRGEFDFHIL